ncbi:DUF3598 family protein [Synechococcus sp. CBW1107]|uniref:DUF3598 family protein n=1 Tax=Synechococcus sp. CBW1107 TaxID=2789857 RepID=UPI002AD2E37F|nr:DUF3598 family protein [Synechococcus sp. CBW1107]CAK6701854.1 hypothetical protein ICNINCKA_03238 [Synechococcus sp. CBW1107]
MSSLDRRSTLLGRNAGHWEGTFIRLDDQGLESERFGTRLHVHETDGQIEAALTYLNTGKVATMRFAEPPALTAISPDGHWSLGPDKTGPWPAVMELCLVDGDRRRRVVVRHGAERLESVVVVVEARPGVVDPAPAPLLRAAVLPVGDGSASGCWKLTDDLTLTTALERRFGDPLVVRLCWRPEPGRELVLERAYGANGLPQP